MSMTHWPAGATLRLAAALVALGAGASVEATTTIQYDHSFAVDSFRVIVDGVAGTSVPLATPMLGSGPLALTLGSPSESWAPGPGEGETRHTVRYAVSFSSIDLLPALMPLTIPTGFPAESTSGSGFITFSRTESASVPVSAPAWTLEAMRLERSRGSSIFDPGTFTVDLVSRGDMLSPLFGLFDTTFADLEPLTIAQGLVGTDKCYTATVCLPYNLFGYSIRSASQTFDIKAGTSTGTETVYFGTLQLRNPVLVVPEPASAALWLLGAALVGVAVRRGRSRADGPTSVPSRR